MAYRLFRTSSMAFVPFLVAGTALLFYLNADGPEQTEERRLSLSVRDNPERSVAEYVTYGWAPFQSPAKEEDVHETIVSVVDEFLKERGYTLDQVNPDFHVLYSFEVYKERRREIDDLPSIYEPVDESWEHLVDKVLEPYEKEDTVVVEQLELSLEFFDANTDIFLWAAEATYPWVRKRGLAGLLPGLGQERSLEVAISDMLHRLPSARKQPE